VDLDANTGLATLVDDLEGEVLNVILDRLVVELLTDETLLQRLLVPVLCMRRDAQLTISKMVR
jgi:hypothetical protein